MQLKDKIAIITGGGRDIGRAISLRFASEGAKVVINYFHTKDKAEETLKMIREQGGEGMIIQADVTKVDDVEKLKQQTLDKYGKIDILVNNAGGLVARKSLEEMTEDFYYEVVDLNFKSVVLVSKAIMPNMKEGSTVVNVSSQAARDGGGNGSALYAASKAAVSSFTRSMAKEFGPKGIRVNAVCPGMIDTLFHDTFTPDDARKKVAASTPLRREGDASDVADLVCYLASDQSAYINGVNYDINGGMVFS